MHKKKVLFINSVCGFGSTGKIVVDLANLNEFDTLICYGRNENLSSNTNVYRIGNKLDTVISMCRTIIFNNNLSLCKKNTIKLIERIKKFEPDLIHLHNIHGYYINVELLFNFLKEYKKPVIWTLHDCWSYTGYCCHYDLLKCDNFKNGCKNCPHGFSYPFSIFKQNISKDYFSKKNMFTNIDDLTIVTPSTWLKKEVKKSFLKEKEVLVINNGIDINASKYEKIDDTKFKVLAVANIWTVEKGIKELIDIVNYIDEDIDVIIVGKIPNKYQKKLKDRCILIERTDNKAELNRIYCTSDIFINPTLQDNFPTVNIEAISCGLPIITYNTGGSIEVINEDTGIIIEKFNKKQFANVINDIRNNDTFDRKRIMEYSRNYSKELMLQKYKELYYEKLEMSASNENS